MPLMSVMGGVNRPSLRETCVTEKKSSEVESGIPSTRTFLNTVLAMLGTVRGRGGRNSVE